MSGHDPASLVAAQRVAGWLRPAWVEVDLSAITANVAHIGAVVGPSAVCAVVKADGYGHGAVPVARAALEGGAAYLGVALAEEGHELRQAGIEVPVLVLSEPPAEAMGLVVEDNLTATIYTDDGLAALLEAAALARPDRETGGGRGRPVPVHLKVDTGMHRVGARPADLVGLARRVAAHPALALEGLFTHLAVADEPDDPFTGEQLDRFELVVRAWRPKVSTPRCSTRRTRPVPCAILVLATRWCGRAWPSTGRLPPPPYGRPPWSHRSSRPCR